MELEEENEEVLRQIAYGVEYLAKETYNLEDIRKTKLTSPMKLLKGLFYTNNAILGEGK